MTARRAIDRELRDLAALPDGHYDLNEPPRPWWMFWAPPPARGGWVRVWRDPDGRIHLMWTTGKDTHNGLACKAQSLTLTPSGQLICYMESALSMWVKWGYGFGDDDDLRRALDFAAWVHGRLCAGEAMP